MGTGPAALGGAQPGLTAPTPPAAPAAPLATGAVVDSRAERIGTVTHYYEHAGACVVRLETGGIAVGDTVHIRGHTTDYYQRVERLERDHASIASAAPGEEIGLQVSQRVREHDGVFRLRR